MDPPPPTTLADLSPLARALAASLAATALVTAYRITRLLAVAAAAAAGAGGGQGGQQPEEEEEVARPARRRRLSPPEKAAPPAHRPRLTETAAHALPCAVVAVAVSDSGAVAAAGADAAVRVWPPARGRGRAAPQTLALAPEGTSVADVAATPDGGWAVLTRDGAGGGGEVVTFDGAGAETATHAVGRGGARPAFLAAADTALVVVTDKAGVELVGSAGGAASAGGVRAKGAAGAAGRVVVATLAPALPVFAISGRRLTGPTFSLTPPGGPPTAVAAAGRAVAVAARDKSVSVFDLPARGRAGAPAVAATAAAPPGTPEPYRAVAVSGDGATVVAAAGRALHVLTPRDGGGDQTLADQTTLPADAAALAMADGCVVVGCDDGSVRVYKIE